MPLLRSAKILVIDNNNNVLVLRRSETHPTAAFEPDLPGGVVEKGETTEQGAVRELLEETGILLDISNIVNPSETVKETKGPYEIERDLFVVYIDDEKPEVTLSWEHDQYSWVPIHELKGLEDPTQLAVDDIIATIE